MNQTMVNNADDDDELEAEIVFISIYIFAIISLFVLIGSSFKWLIINLGFDKSVE